MKDCGTDELAVANNTGQVSNCYYMNGRATSTFFTQRTLDNLGFVVATTSADIKLLEKCGQLVTPSDALSSSSNGRLYISFTLL